MNSNDVIWAFSVTSYWSMLFDLWILLPSIFLGRSYSMMTKLAWQCHNNPSWLQILPLTILWSQFHVFITWFTLFGTNKMAILFVSRNFASLISNPYMELIVMASIGRQTLYILQLNHNFFLKTFKPRYLYSHGLMFSSFTF